MNLRAAVKKAMRERDVTQQALARACGLSQGHLSKVLGGLEMGARTQGRLQKWLDYPDDCGRSVVLAAEDLRRMGALLKQHCEELALFSQAGLVGRNRTKGERPA